MNIVLLPHNSKSRKSCAKPCARVDEDSSDLFLPQDEQAILPQSHCIVSAPAPDRSTCGVPLLDSFHHIAFLLMWPSKYHTERKNSSCNLLATSLLNQPQVLLTLMGAISH